MHSLEVVLDDDTDREIRSQWNVLLDADMPSQARHTGASNRPHITLALADTLDAFDLTRLSTASAALPMPVTIGGLLVFGFRRFVLARLAIASEALLGVQKAMVEALAEPVDPHGTFAAGRWTPHVTLARRLSADQLAQAVDILGEQLPLTGEISRARRWDMTAKQESWIG